MSVIKKNSRLNILEKYLPDKRKSQRKRQEQIEETPKFVFNPQSTVMPAVVEETVAFLEKEGIGVEGVFRVSGTKDDIAKILAAYNSGKHYVLKSFMTNDVHVVSGVLKTWLRELPEPLLTWELYECFLAAIGIPSESSRLDCLCKVIGLLPPFNRMILKRLFALLKLIAQNSEVNKMSPLNIAIVFAPTLCRPKEETIDIVMADSSHNNKLIETLITEYDEIFMKVQADQQPKSPRLDKPTQVMNFRQKLKKGTFKLARRFLLEQQEVEEKQEEFTSKEQELLKEAFHRARQKKREPVFTKSKSATDLFNQTPPSPTVEESEEQSTLTTDLMTENEDVHQEDDHVEKPVEPPVVETIVDVLLDGRGEVVETFLDTLTVTQRKKTILMMRTILEQKQNAIDQHH